MQLRRIKAVVREIASCAFGRCGVTDYTTPEGKQVEIRFQIGGSVWTREAPTIGQEVFLSSIYHNNSEWMHGYWAEIAEPWKSIHQQIQELEQIDGVVWIAHSLYVKTPEALAKLLNHLRQTGYKIKNQREDAHRLREGVSVDQMERNGWSLWFATLDTTHHHKCKSCGGYMTATQAFTHEGECPHCRAITHRHLHEGAFVTFSFNNRATRHLFTKVIMRVRRYNAKRGFIDFYPLNARDQSPGEFSAVQQYLVANRDLWKKVKRAGKTFIRIKYRGNNPDAQDRVISLSHVIGEYTNTSPVTLFRGSEFKSGFLSETPLQDMFSIYECWHWAPLPQSPTLYERIFQAAAQVFRPDYYHQDGHTAFWPMQFEWMTDFAVNFTMLDATRWYQAVRQFRTDGPGAIEDIASFCDPQSRIFPGPDIRNLINALNMEGRYGDGILTDEEIAAVQRSAADPETLAEFRRWTESEFF